MADYATVDELKAYMGIEDTQDDVILELAIAAASAAIDQFTNTTFSEDDIPAGIKYACLIQASRLVKRKDAPFGVAGSPAMGSEMRLLDRLDPDVVVHARPHKVWWGAVSGESE